VQYTH